MRKPRRVVLFFDSGDESRKARTVKALVERAREIHGATVVTVPVRGLDAPEITVDDGVALRDLATIARELGLSAPELP